MKTHILLSAVVALSACTLAPSVPASSPMMTSEWGVGEPASPIGDGRRTEQAPTSAVSNTTTRATGATVTASATGGVATKAADVADGDSVRGGGSVEHDTLPRSINFTPRPINTGDPCGDCARAR